MLKEERWAIIARANDYSVSESGVVRRNRDGFILKQYTDRYGYHYVSLNGKKCKIHRLVAEAFIGPVEGYEIDHIDTNRTNNHVFNLRIVTRKENANNPLTILNLKKHSDEYKKKYSRKVKDNNGNYFQSIIEASRQTKTPRATIQYHIKNNTGVWQYA